MTSPLLDNAPYGAYLILLGLIVRFLYRRIRPWIRTREEMAKDKAKARRQTAAFFSAFVLACAVAFALLILLAATVPQTYPRTPIIMLLAGAVGALGVMGALLLVFGLPAYNSVIDMEEQHQSLEEKYHSLDLQNQTLELLNQKLEYRSQSQEERLRKLEERIKAIESQGQASGLLEEQLPMQRNLAFMEMWQVQKRDHDTDLMKSSRMSRLNSAAP